MAGQSNGNGFVSRYGVIVSTVGVVVLVCGGFWGAVIGPMVSRIEKLELGTIGIREHTEFRFRLDQEIVRLRLDFQRLADSLVSRPEHTEKWRSNDIANANQQRQIDEINKRLGDTYTLRDALGALDKRIDRLSNIVLQAPQPGAAKQ